MIKKPDLRIDTEFFDDNLNDLNIPEAIKVTQSIDTQNFIKEGLNDEPIDASTILAVQTFEKIISQRLISNFLACWNKLKSNNNSQISHRSTPYSQRGHRRQSQLVRNVSNDHQITAESTEFRGIGRQKGQFYKIRQNLQDGALEWLEQQRRNIKSRTVLRGWSHSKVTPAETHYERAKVLKEIVDKLRHGRQLVTGLIDQFDTQRQNEHLHHKLDKLERLMEDVHYSTTQRGTNISEKLPSSNSQQVSRKPVDDLEGEIVIRLKQQLLEVKSEMERIRKANQQILREEQWKKAEIMKIASTRQQIKHQYETLRYQINYLEQEKQANQIRNLRLQQELSIHNANKQQYERQISYLSQMVNNNERINNNNEKNQQKLATSNQIISSTTNQFGYSTLTTSQRVSNSAVKTLVQAKPVESAPAQFPINEVARQSADDWACC